MKKLLIALTMLCFASGAFAGDKLLVITSNNGTGRTIKSEQICNVFDRAMKILGVASKDMLFVDAAAKFDSNGDGTRDSSYVIHYANTGDYAMAVALNLPEFGASYNSVAELRSAGLGDLGHWVDIDGPNAFPIPLFMPLAEALPTTGIWGSNVGIVGTTTLGSHYQPYVNSDGDSIYVHIHGNANAVPRIADSLSWCEALAWIDTPVGSTTQKMSEFWKITGTDDSKIIFLKEAEETWATGLFFSVFAMYLPVQPLDICLGLREFGYKDNPSSGTDTTGYSKGLWDVAKAAKAYGMKIDLFTMACRHDDWGGGTPNDLETFASVASAYSDNIRYTHSTYDSYDDNNDWLGVLCNRNQAAIEAQIAHNIDSTATDSYLAPLLSTTRLKAYQWRYAGRYQNWTTYPMVEVFNAMANQGIKEIYVVTNVDGNCMWPGWSGWDKSIGIVYPCRTWVGSSYKEMKSYTWGKGLAGYYGSGVDNQQVAGTAAERASVCANVFKFPFGGYALVYNADQSISSGSGKISLKVARRAIYAPGMEFLAGLLGGDNTMLEIMGLIDVYVDFHNNLIKSNGNVDQVIAQYTWSEEATYGRKTGMQFTNSRVNKK